MESSILDKPNIVQAVVKFLGPKECCRYAAINKTWKEYTDSPWRWRNHILETWPGMQVVVDTLAKAMRGGGGGGQGKDPVSYKELFKRRWQPVRGFGDAVVFAQDNRALLQSLVQGLYIQVELKDGRSGRVWAHAMLPVGDPQVMEDVFTGRGSQGKEMVVVGPQPQDPYQCRATVTLMDAREGDVMYHCHVNRFPSPEDWEERDRSMVAIFGASMGNRWNGRGEGVELDGDDPEAEVCRSSLYDVGEEEEQYYDRREPDSEAGLLLPRFMIMEDGGSGEKRVVVTIRAVKGSDMNGRGSLTSSPEGVWFLIIKYWVPKALARLARRGQRRKMVEEEEGEW